MGIGDGQNDFHFYTINEIILNNKVIKKNAGLVDEEGDHGNILREDQFSIYFKERFVVIEFKIEGQHYEEGNIDVDFNFRKAFTLSFSYGTSFKFEIIPNGNKLRYSEENTTFNPISQNNSIIYSGTYEFKDEDYNKDEFVKEYKREDPEFNPEELADFEIKCKWLEKKYSKFLPSKIFLE